jgi:hypothetical protein
MSRSYTFSPPSASMACRGTVLLFMIKKRTEKISGVTFWTKAVPWLRSLVAGLSPRRPGFAPWSIHVGFAVDKVALGQVYLVLRFSPVNIIRPSLSKLVYANVSRHPHLGTRPHHQEKKILDKGDLEDRERYEMIILKHI